MLFALGLSVLAGCSPEAERSTPPTPSAPPTASVASSTVGGPAVRQTIDLGGEEAYGLALSDKYVWAVSYQAGTVSQVDPATGAVLKSTGSGVAVLLAVDGTLWAAGYDGTLVRIDPDTGSVAATLSLGEICCDLTAGGGAIWAVDPGGAVLRIDPAMNRVRRHPVRVDRNRHTNAVYAGDSIWVSSDNTDLMRMDPGTGTIKRIDVGGGVPFLARDGMLWGAATDRLWVVDTRTGKVARRIPLTDSAEVLSLGLGFDAIWVGIRHPGRVGAVLKLDAASGKQVSEVPVDIPARIETGFGSVWVTDSGSRSLVRISP
jgi:DNA-binding beta-propeller fold protein YncE